MIRKTLTAVVAAFGLSFAGAAFAAPAKPAAVETSGAKSVKPMAHKRLKVARLPKGAKPMAKPAAQKVDMSKQAKTQPRVAHRKVLRLNKKAQRAGSSKVKVQAPKTSAMAK